MNDIGVDEIYEAGEGIQGERRNLRANFTSLRLAFTALQLIRTPYPMKVMEVGVDVILIHTI